MRSILVLILSLAIASNGEAESSREWRFLAELDGDPIGEHIFSLTERNSKEINLKSSANFKVKFLFFTAYTYKHVAEERWRADCLQALKSETEENSAVTTVSAGLEGKQFIIKSPKGELVANICPMTFAYWNPKILSQKELLNPQTGELLPVEIQFLGTEEIVVRGERKTTEHYKITAPKTEIDLFYEVDSESGVKNWVALESKTPEGYTVSYKLTAY